MLRSEDLSLILHQFGNLLQPISYRIERLGEFPLDDAELNDARKSLAARIVALTRTLERLRMLAAPVALNPGKVNLPALVKAVWGDVTCGMTIASELEAAAWNGELPGDPYWLHLAFRELLTNAMEAAAQSAAPAIRIRIEKADRFWRIHIRDSGPGISGAVLPPKLFFTTKSESGAGLGLLLAVHILEAHQGQLSLADLPESSPGAGPGLGRGISVLLPRA